MLSRQFVAAPVYVAGPALTLAAITAATLLFYSARDELPDGLRPRRTLISATASLPPPQDRLFGPPLRRVRLDDETQDFEPEAYARRDTLPSARVGLLVCASANVACARHAANTAGFISPVPTPSTITAGR